MATAIAKTNPPKKRRMAAPRKEIDPRTQDVKERFALRLRERADAKGWGPSDIQKEMAKIGHKISLNLVTRWLNADRFPRPEALVAVFHLLSDDGDWRTFLPDWKPPRKTAK